MKISKKTKTVIFVIAGLGIVYYLYRRFKR